jgi:hypothetical protein
MNVTAGEDSVMGECKLTKREQTTFLSEVLSNRARREERNVIYPFPHKKQSWIMANDDFDALGYATLTFQTGKNDAIAMLVAVDVKYPPPHAGNYARAATASRTSRNWANSPTNFASRRASLSFSSSSATSTSRGSPSGRPKASPFPTNSSPPRPNTKKCPDPYYACLPPIYHPPL